MAAKSGSGRTRLASRNTLLGRIAVPPRGTGIALAALFLAATGLYGLSFEGPAAKAVGGPGDFLANLAGFQIETASILGQNALTDEEILSAAGVTDTSSLPFLDVEAARQGLLALPMIASATVHKLYPDTLAITIEEREPSAAWQKGGEVQVVSADGTPIQPYDPVRFGDLPLLVGDGANKSAGEIEAALEATPEVMEDVRAAVRVADRRWNLVMRNGVIVRLPETDVAAAVAEFARLRREEDLDNKAILSVDLRLVDRITFRLTAEAAAERAAEREAASKKKGRTT